MGGLQRSVRVHPFLPSSPSHVLTGGPTCETFWLLVVVVVVVVFVLLDCVPLPDDTVLLFPSVAAC